MNERIKFDWREIELISAHSLARATKPRIAHDSDESRSSLWAERARSKQRSDSFAQGERARTHLLQHREGKNRLDGYKDFD